jgi:BirA family transcriptional regulator, biotin operon repressor / biotin---[acetyl-CoA-carboxylase] ligase
LPSSFLSHIIGQPFTELPETESTNNYAMALAQKGLATHGSAWFAHHQTAGKGQRGRQWNSMPKQNIILSVLLDMKWLPVSEQFYLSAAIALAANDLFAKYAGENTTIKWPNDIYWNDRKAAGILIENIIRGNSWQWAIAGIGININQTAFDKTLKNPVSLKQITGKAFDVIVLAKELCENIQQHFSQLQNGNKIEVLKAYNNVLYKKNEEVKLKKDNAIFSYVIKNVNASGQLIVEGVAKNSFDFGEVKFVISP